jgi:hypothetical protein
VSGDRLLLDHAAEGVRVGFRQAAHCADLFGFVDEQRPAARHVRNRSHGHTRQEMLAPAPKVPRERKKDVDVVQPCST